MKKRVFESLSHGLVAFLYSLGLVLTLLSVLGMNDRMGEAAAVVLAVTAVCTAVSLVKWSSLVLCVLSVVAGGAWLSLMGGMTVLMDVLRAVMLHLSGQTAALPLVAREASMLLCAVCGVGGFLLSYPRSGGYPAMSVLLGAVLLLWLGDQPQAMVYMLPAIAATVAMTLHQNYTVLPIRRILPLAGALTVVAFLLVPASGVTIQPMKDFADDLRQKIFDYLFFTEPRSVFTLAAEGYYPQGQNQLGGPVSPSEEPVMVVSTPKRVYLRGTVKDQYTGRIWVDTKAGRRYLWVSPQWRQERQSYFNMALPGGALGADEGLMRVEQVSVRMVSASASTLFVPQRIRELSPGGDLVPYFNISSEVFATRDLAPGDTYTVSAPLMTGGEAGMGTLVNAAAASGDSLYGQIRQEYLQLPDHLQQELYDLAEKATSGASTPYEKALALQVYLSHNYRYALDVELQPGNVDFVSNFLLNTKEGYCTYFASAMTVLCRMAGLPARYVEGYLCTPDDAGTAYVTGLDGHAWTEVYFEGFGWLTFDATPSQLNNRGNQQNQENRQDPQDEELPTPPPEQSPPPEEEPSPTPSPSPDPQKQPTPSPSPEQDDQPSRDPGDPPSYDWLWWLLLLLLILAAALRIFLTQPQRLALRQTDELGRWTVWMQALHDALRVLRLPRRPSESPLAYMRRLDSLRRLRAELTPLGECESLVFYGRLDPEPEETMMAAASYTQITSGMRWHEKARLMLLRAFLPLKKRDFTST